MRVTLVVNYGDLVCIVNDKIRVLGEFLQMTIAG